MADAGFRVGDTVAVDSLYSRGEDGYADTEFEVRISSVAEERGGMSTLFIGDARTVRGDRAQVAIKVVRASDCGGDIRGRELFLRELSAVQKARHKFILPFCGAADEGDRLLIVSPFMRNGNLLCYVRDKPQVDRLRLVTQVSDAVCHLHTVLNMVHGDIKCENVLISDHGEALLTDFGLSTLLDKQTSDATTATAIRAWKTIRFAAPELLLDDARSASNRIRSKTSASDVYAFGMFLVQAFTGMRPWPDCNEHQVAAMVLAHQQTHPRPSSGILGTDSELWDLCVSCWEWNPQMRPPVDHVGDSLAALANTGHAGVGVNDESPSSEVQPLLGAPASLSNFEFILLTQARGTARRRRVIMLQFKRAAAVFFFFLTDAEEAGT